ncbi:hypothetical protein R3W88_018112 [Solanum pinnatisectum]|uniref:Aluminum-activated malate transporter n=1 Tax=Solanum pinnatisectum TaxID=50273 RepID=A0AAV9L2J9_9SOLN|nr:hypothetical protein R3W88_018112 [Solanum pinnatisectum]
MTVIVENQAEVAECGCFLNAWLCFKQLVKKLMFKVVHNAISAKKLGKEDPRIIVHSLKVGMYSIQSSFLPKLKARYDYGVLIFILTFSLVSVSGYHYKQVLEMAETRVSSILIGCAIALLVCIFICPVWAAQQLHNKFSSNFENLGSFLEGWASRAAGEEKTPDLQGYKSANFAKWEPRHGKFRYRHPWAQYLEIGGIARDCALSNSCPKLSTESGHVLNELALAMKTMTYPLTITVHIDNAKIAAENLKSLLHTNSSWEGINFSDIIPMATVDSLLIEIVSYTTKMVESFDQIKTNSWKTKRVTPDQPSTESVHHDVAAE